MEDLINQVIFWGKQHNIDNPQRQALKVTEEWGETIEEFNHERLGEEFKDGIGDTLVSLIIFADIMGVDIKESLAKSLDTIQNRKGITSDGNFIREDYGNEK